MFPPLEQRQYLHCDAGEQRDAQPEPRPDLATDEIGDNAHQLAQPERKGQVEGREAKGMKVQQHQHAQRHIRQGEGPLGGGDDGVATDVGRGVCAKI